MIVAVPDVALPFSTHQMFKTAGWYFAYRSSVFRVFGLGFASGSACGGGDVTCDAGFVRESFGSVRAIGCGVCFFTGLETSGVDVSVAFDRAGVIVAVSGAGETAAGILLTWEYENKPIAAKQIPRSVSNIFCIVSLYRKGVLRRHIDKNCIIIYNNQSLLGMVGCSCRALNALCFRSNVLGKRNLCKELAGWKEDSRSLSSRGFLIDSE